MEKVTYKEASDKLEVSIDTLQQAIGRGVFTKILAPEKVKHLHRKQVELFINKPRLSLHALTPEERKLWEEYREEATQSIQPVLQFPELNYRKLARALIEEMNNEKRDRERGETASPFSIPAMKA